MRRNIFLFTILFCIHFLLLTHSNAQEVNRCGTAEYLQLQEAKHPGSIQRLKDAQSIADQWLQDHPGGVRTQMIIPVVVHVVWNTNSQNISDEQIQSQIDVLYEDFNRLNGDTFKTPDVWQSVAGSLPIKFCLASYDPNGDSTSGITRTQTDVESFDLGDDVKHSDLGGEDPWPSNHYLNIWVCNLGSNTLGYTSFSPGFPDDGVVVLYTAFGRVGNVHFPYNKGRTCTHEVGHWLSLSHTWGDDGGDCTGDDGCNDTPREGDKVFGCEVFPFFDACSGAPNGVMFMNYMDYTDDACMNIFTQCQVGKMQAVLSTSRNSLLSSPGGCQGLKFNLDAAISTIVYPADTLQTQGFQPQVQLSNRGIDEITYVRINYQVDGQIPLTYDFTGTLPSQGSTLITLPYYFTSENGHVSYAWTANPNHGTDQFVFNDSSSAPFYVRSSVSKNTVSIVVEDVFTNQPKITVLNPSAPLLHLQVVNVLGQVIQEGNWEVISSPSFTIDLSDVPAGVYFLHGKIGFDYVKKKLMILKK